MENNNQYELDEQNNLEELEDQNLYENMENNNNINDNQYLNQEREDRYEGMDEDVEGGQDDPNYLNDNIYDDQNNDGEDDDRLTYTLITLDLGDLIHIFEENNISFVDMLLLSKDDLKELQLKLYQRNRIHNFSVLFNRYAKNYSISEISDFFSFNQKFIFNSSIYDRVISPQNQNDYLNNENNDELQNDNDNDNELNNNLDDYDNVENKNNNGNNENNDEENNNNDKNEEEEKNDEEEDNNNQENNAIENEGNE